MSISFESEETKKPVKVFNKKLTINCKDSENIIDNQNLFDNKNIVNNQTSDNFFFKKPKCDKQMKGLKKSDGFENISLKLK